MFDSIGMHARFHLVILHTIWSIARDTIMVAKQCAVQQMIQIEMNLNRIINKYIISKYVKRENKPG